MILSASSMNFTLMKRSVIKVKKYHLHFLKTLITLRFIKATILYFFKGKDSEVMSWKKPSELIPVRILYW